MAVIVARSAGFSSDQDGCLDSCTDKVRTSLNINKTHQIFSHSVHVRTGASQSSYCSLSPSHIMCKYREGVSSYCGSYYYRGLTQEEKIEIVDEHNKLRSRLAMGHTDHPAAANMQELQWDEELAVLAQRHADQCRFVHDCSDCRKVSRFRVGQNLLRDKSVSYEGPDWRFSIQSWFREIENYPNLDSSARYRCEMCLIILYQYCHQVSNRHRTLCTDELGHHTISGVWVYLL